MTTKRALPVFVLFLFGLGLLVMPARGAPADFTIVNADATNYIGFSGSSVLSTLINNVLARIILENADQERVRDFEPAPASLQNLTEQLLPRIILQAADESRVITSPFPMQLVDDSTPPVPALQPPTFGSTFAIVRWTTDEFATSSIRYGTQSNNYTHTLTDTLFRTEHEFRLDGLIPETTYYYRLENTDQSGNTALTAEYQLDLPDTAYLFLPLLTSN